MMMGPVAWIYGSFAGSSNNPNVFRCSNTECRCDLSDRYRDFNLARWVLFQTELTESHPLGVYTWRTDHFLNERCECPDCGTPFEVTFETSIRALLISCAVEAHDIEYDWQALFTSIRPELPKFFGKRMHFVAELVWEVLKKEYGVTAEVLEILQRKFLEELHAFEEDRGYHVMASALAVAFADEVRINCDSSNRDQLAQLLRLGQLLLSVTGVVKEAGIEKEGHAFLDTLTEISRMFLKLPLEKP